MPAATSRDTLLAVMDAEWVKLTQLLDRVPEDFAISPRGDDASIRDIVTHRTHWIGLFFQWLDEGAAAQMPDHGVKWNQLKSYNANLRDRYGDVAWEAARRGLADAHAKLRTWIMEADEDALYDGPMRGVTGWTAGRYAEAAGPSHYRSAATYIRAVLRRAG